MMPGNHLSMEQEDPYLELIIKNKIFRGQVQHLDTQSIQGGNYDPKEYLNLYLAIRLYQLISLKNIQNFDNQYNLTLYFKQKLEMLDDDRPIHPNQQYILQKQVESLNNKDPHLYLKKDKNAHLLPCQRHQARSKQIHIISNDKSKAQIYQEIKRKNIQKFGPRRDKILQPQRIQPKKINPSKMTVNYNSKPKIQLQEYKQKDYKPNQIQKQKRQNRTSNAARQKYQKLLQIFKEDQQNLNIKKEKFQKYQQSLKFKKQIQNQQTIPFVKTIRQQISTRMLKQKLKTHQDQDNVKKALNSPHNSNQNKKQNMQKNKLNRVLISSEIAQFIDKATTQKQRMKQKLFQSTNSIKQGQNQIIVRMYSIQNYNQIPKFDVQNTKEFIDLKMLQPKNNNYYKKAVAIFQNGLKYQNNQEIKYKVQKKTFTQTQIIEGFNLQQGQIQVSSDNQHQQKVTVKKVRMEGQKRVAKYDNNWIQVWHPGHQRLIAAPNNEYKIVWLRNGDIKQQWRSKGINSYYCKAKNLVRINYKKFEPIMYFIDLNQLQQSNSDKTEKQILFRDGRIQIISIK